ncbi:hypothetical protein MMC14_001756 [Varicellaria rhodocarpa]|nr:hypothetical protein [Varicellaria rhodocarpa]
MYTSLFLAVSLPLTTLALDTSLFVSSSTSPPHSDFHTVLPSITVSTSFVTSLPTSTPTISTISKPNHFTKTFLSVSLRSRSTQVPDNPSLDIRPPENLQRQRPNLNRALSHAELQTSNFSCQNVNGALIPLSDIALCETPYSHNRSLPKSNLHFMNSANSSTSSTPPTSSRLASGTETVSKGILTMISSNGDLEDSTSEGASLWIFGFLGIVLAGSAYVGLTGAPPSEVVREEGLN